MMIRLLISVRSSGRGKLFTSLPRAVTEFIHSRYHRYHLFIIRGHWYPGDPL